MKAAASCRNVWYFNDNLWLVISAREPWVMQPSWTSFFIMYVHGVVKCSLLWIFFLLLLAKLPAAAAETYLVMHILPVFITHARWFRIMSQAIEMLLYNYHLGAHYHSNGINAKIYNSSMHWCDWCWAHLSPALVYWRKNFSCCFSFSSCNNWRTAPWSKCELRSWAMTLLTITRMSWGFG